MTGPNAHRNDTTSAPDSAPDPAEQPSVSSLIFLGTGTSEQVPRIPCLTDPDATCLVCPSTLHAETRKNRRRNTSAFVTLSNGKTILIDCGKSFFDAALQVWPRARLRQIDALLITHAHADAMLGLDDLRAWTHGGVVQDSVHIYLSAATYASVATMFPYMIDVSKATGGGDVPAFQWHIIDEDESFFVKSCNVHVQALPVEHGSTFDEIRKPFMCLGFRIGDVSYISDASSIPAATRQLLQGDDHASRSRVMVLDALKNAPHTSHMSIPETLEFVNDLDRPADHTYLTDFTHNIDHYLLEDQLKHEKRSHVAPAYDGLQLVFKRDCDEFIQEVDLFAEKTHVAVREQDRHADLRRPLTLR